MPAKPVRTTKFLSAAALGVAVVTSLAACGSSDHSASAGSTSPSSAASTGTAKTANVTISEASGCASDATTFAAGAITFNVANKDATAVSEIELLGGERIIGEKENIPPGFSGNFAVNVDAGKYTLYCPGATTEKTAITVTGTATSTGDQDTASLLATGTKQWGEYVNTQVGYLVASATALDTAVASGDLTASQDAYKKARPYYEKIEPVAESFAIGDDSLDADLDAREGDVPDAQWTGFHRIEKALFDTRSLDGLQTYTTGLVANAKKLQGLTADLTYKPSELANGAQDLLDEVSSSKITGEEERYSHIDILDFQANDEGAEQAFADLLPGLTTIDPTLAASVTSNFTALNTLVDKYRSSDDASGFVLYGTLTDADKQALAAAVKAVQEPLSQVASKVANS
jgi:iron uptake system component EfeO